MIVRKKITQGELEKIFDSSFGTVLKITVDIEKEILSLGCEFHIDCAEELTEKEGSRQKNLWGANFYHQDKTIDCISLINIKPLENNRSMNIENPVIKQIVEKIIKDLLCN
jgi:hypothetical protein